MQFCQQRLQKQWHLREDLISPLLTHHAMLYLHTIRVVSKRPYAIVFLYMDTSCPVYSGWYPNSFSAQQILWRHIDCCQYLLSYWPTSTHEYWKANQVRLLCFGKNTNTVFSGIKLLTFGNGGWLMVGCQNEQDFFCRLCHVFFNCQNCV